MTNVTFILNERLGDFLAGMPGRRKFANVRAADGCGWAAPDEAGAKAVEAGLRGPRPPYSAKSVLMPASETVALYGEAEGDPLAEAAERSTALIGVRGCECRGLAYLDAIMLDQPRAEPFYEARRRSTTIVSVDCAEAAGTCFCNLFGEKAYAESGSDVNLSPVEDGFLVEAGSEAGERVLKANASLLREATAAMVAERDAMRARTAAQLAEQNREYGFPKQMADAFAATVEAGLWVPELAECVQCGGCTAVCPTCYCFLLYDQARADRCYERVRVWDSCQFTGYSQMAGAPGTLPPDPRRTHLSKVQHRVFHKFWYNSLYPGRLGCVGCGRCRDTCPGAIDLRRVVTSVAAAHAEHA